MSNNNQTAPHVPRGTNPRKSNIGCAAPFLVFVAIMFFIGHLIMIISVTRFFSSISYDEPSQHMHQGEYVAVLYVNGIISMQESSNSIFAEPTGYDHGFLIDTLYKLASDDNNLGILLYIDSPGGQVYATDELYLELLRYKQVTGRPIYAYCAQVAASGGYYVAMAADQVFMNRNGITGSIGVSAGTFIDLSGFLEEQGIRTTSIYVGDNKAMGSMFEEFTQEQQAIYLSLLTETYDQFVDVVVAGRPLRRDEVLRLSDGRIFSPAQALELDLIDGVMSYEDACWRFISDMEWSAETQFVHYQPDLTLSFLDLFLMFSRGGKTDLEIYLSYLDIPFEGFAYYYEGPHF